MSEQLPIRITGEHFEPEVVNNIEAWANFETLKANWFGDESRIVDCHLEVLEQEAFTAALSDYQSKQSVVSETHGFALVIDKQNLKVQGIVAVEASILKKQLKSRVKKVLRILVATLSLPSL